MAAKWQGPNTITGCKARSGNITGDSAALPDELNAQLNAFNARFEQKANRAVARGPSGPIVPLPRVTVAEVRSAFLRANPRNATGPDGVPGRVLSSCADQLAGVFTDIFNLSLLRSAVSTRVKKTTIIPVPKKGKTSRLNDHLPAALTSTIMKCFERLVMEHIKSCPPSGLDPLQFTYCYNRSTDDAITPALLIPGTPG
ncbi:uncharacterized protein LOC144595825 [Rhinoraja longicauda]